MSILKVARIGHPVVRTVAKEVPDSAYGEAGFQRLIDDMQETMYEYEGVGLAAPQIHEGLRLAVLEVPGSDDRADAEVPFTVLVNPVITPLGNETETGWEGCLSIPDLRGLVPRLTRLRLEALDRDGKPYSLEASGFFARGHPARVRPPGRQRVPRPHGRHEDPLVHQGVRGARPAGRGRELRRGTGTSSRFSSNSVRTLLLEKSLEVRVSKSHRFGLGLWGHWPTESRNSP